MPTLAQIKAVVHRIMELMPDDFAKGEASNNFRVKKPAGASFARLVETVRTLLEDESYPGTATLMLSDWEALLNLVPDDLSDLPARRAAILAKLTEDRGLTVDDVTSLFAECGFEWARDPVDRLRASDQSSPDRPALNDSWGFYTRLALRPDTDTLSPSWDCPDTKLARFPAHAIVDLDKGGRLRSEFVSDTGVYTAGPTVTLWEDPGPAGVDMNYGSPKPSRVLDTWMGEPVIRFGASNQQLFSDPLALQQIDVADGIYALITFIPRSAAVGLVLSVRDWDDSDPVFEILSAGGGFIAITLGSELIEVVPSYTNRPVTIEFVSGRYLDRSVVQAAGEAAWILRAHYANEEHVLEGVEVYPTAGAGPAVFMGRGDVLDGAVFDLLSVRLAGADGRPPHRLDRNALFDAEIARYHRGQTWTEYDMAVGVTQAGTISAVANQRIMGGVVQATGGLRPAYVADLYGGNPSARFTSTKFLESVDAVENHVSERAAYILCAFVARSTEVYPVPVAEVITAHDSGSRAISLRWSAPSTVTVAVDGQTLALPGAVEDIVIVAEVSRQDGDMTLRIDRGAGTQTTSRNDVLTAAFAPGAKLLLGGTGFDGDILYWVVSGADGQIPAQAERDALFAAAVARFVPGTAA